MVAYLHKTPGGGHLLTICSRPCNGEEFQNGKKVVVAGKREAKKVAAENNATPWNF